MGSDAGRAPVTEDDSSGRVYDQDATKATRNSKPLSICSTAFATGVRRKSEEEWRAYLLAIFIKCMLLHVVISSATTAFYVYDCEVKDKDVCATEQTQAQPKRLKKTWSQQVYDAQHLIRKMFSVNKGFTVDSGAAAHVMPRGWITWLVVLASWGSRNGVHYVAANGGRIPNEGESHVFFRTIEGIIGKFIFQIAKVNKPLLSVAMLVKDGMRVVFDEDGSYIYNKRTGEIMRLKQERGVFVLEAFVEHDPAKPAPVDTAAPFSGRE